MPPMSDETRKKISDKNRGRKASAETRHKFSLIRKGKKRGPFTDEWKRHISESMKLLGRWSGENNPKYGKGDSVRGAGNGMYGRHRTEEEKRHLSEIRKRPIAVYRDGQLVATYDSVSTAQRATKVNHIGSIISGKYVNRSGYEFRYLNEV